nr:major facilitator superfamily domain-containing protein 12-like [Penaeus vannamei]XP_027207848.1 major facilitator superfamily domain-containing protein 12-like [Penaeus vannamei]XP_027207849.1 major facilitator superfamily domain-containing protein 12-like [Penaeus vannamei]XP_027207850.1 major facilitator superfamily domain-containing protein 12-like [Penaeus vannamei]XP_027207851.1 major facilitator superfamily domain-containing protein 12-like [Penaeus vannamei]XP_027207852.1 major faci
MAGLTFRTRFGYGVGHVLNDLCSAMWFTYLLIYFHHVLLFNNSLAGVVLLIGQVADALSTPFVGKEADRTDDLAFCARYGRRKSWHLAGTICVLCAFPFIFLGCLGCSGASDWAQVVYYAPFVVIFQFGWASTQISHLALIPNITQDPNDRTELNAIRYAFTVASNITVYLVTWLVLGLESQDPEAGIGPRDINKFRYIVFIVLAIGCLFVTLFHVMVKEDNLPDYATWQRVAINNAEASEPSQAEGTNVASSSACVPVHCRMTATDWLKDRQFYQVAFLYMGTRLFCNLTQAYVPIYLQDSLHLSEESVAYIPLVMYVSGFLTTMILKALNKFIGRKASFILGTLIGGAACIGIWLGEGDVYCKYLLYVVTAMLGAGGSIMLITSLSITADLIGPNIESGAFVYGAMSFTDKLSNGIAVMLIQNLNPCTACCPMCSKYYRDILFYCCGGAAVLGLLALLTLLPVKIGDRSKAGDSATPTADSSSRSIEEDTVGNAPACIKADMSTVACVGPAVSTMAAAGVGPGMGVCGGSTSSAQGEGKESEKTSSNTKDVPIGKSPACAKADVSTIACVGPAISIMSAAGVGPGMSACGDKMSSVTGDGEYTAVPNSVVRVRVRTHSVSSDESDNVSRA